MTIYNAFNRAMVTAIKPDVEALGFKVVKDAWVYNSGGTWEFHGPENFYWWGRAEDAHDARASGWSAFINTKNPTT